jgi:hypothetical protein
MKQLFLFLFLTISCFHTQAQSEQDKLAIAKRLIIETPEFKAFKEKNKNLDMGFEFAKTSDKSYNDKYLLVVVTARELGKLKDDVVGYINKDMTFFDVNLESNKVIWKKLNPGYKADDKAIIIKTIKQ